MDLPSFLQVSMKVFRPIAKNLPIYFHLAHKCFIVRVFMFGLHVIDDVHVSGALQAHLPSHC